MNPVGLDSRLTEMGPRTVFLLRLDSSREVRRRIREHTVDRNSDGAHRRDCYQGNQNQQQSIFRKILTFFFLPEPDQLPFHSLPPIVLSTYRIVLRSQEPTRAPRPLKGMVIFQRPLFHQVCQLPCMYRAPV